MSLMGRLIIQAEMQFGAQLMRLGGQASRVVGVALTFLPDILNFALVVVLIYAAIISCAPIYNELLWTPDEGDAPPIEGKKWEDFDKSMQEILRSYRGGDVKATGGHIAEWNRQVRRRQSRLENAVQAARKYKRALEAERRKSSKLSSENLKGTVTLVQKVKGVLSTRKGLFRSAQRAREEYMKAKADYMQEGKWSAAFIRPKKYGTETTTKDQSALEEADEKNQEAELLAMLEKLKEMKDQPMSGEVVDTTSQFGARSLEDLVSAEDTFTRLWPKAVAPDGIHRVVQAETKELRPLPESETAKVSKEGRLRGEKVQPALSQKPVQMDGEKTYSVFGSQRTVRMPQESKQREQRFGIPVLWVAVPTVLFSAVMYYHVFTTSIAFTTALLSATLLQSWHPLSAFSKVTGAKLLRWYMAIIGGISGAGALFEAVVLTGAEVLASLIVNTFAVLLSLAYEGMNSCGVAVVPVSQRLAKIASILVQFLPPESTNYQKLEAVQRQSHQPAFVQVLDPKRCSHHHVGAHTNVELDRSQIGEVLVVLSKSV